MNIKDNKNYPLIIEQSIAEQALSSTKKKYSKAVEYNKLRSAIELIPNYLAERKACIATIYATGSRAAEIIGSVRKDGNKTIVLPLIYQCVQLSHNDTRITFSIFVAKKRGKKIYRDSVIKEEDEPWLFNILFEYFFTINEKNQIVKRGEPTQPCFNLTYNKLQYTYYEFINKELEMKTAPHYLRHCRISHQIKYFGYSLQEIHEEYQWSDLSQAIVYSHIKNDRAEKHFKAIKEEELNA